MDPDDNGYLIGWIGLTTDTSARCILRQKSEEIQVHGVQKKACSKVHGHADDISLSVGGYN